jgi:hypothetical protein
MRNVGRDPERRPVVEPTRRRKRFPVDRLYEEEKRQGLIGTKLGG